MNVLIGITLAPYRVDFYNRLHDRCDCEIHFVQRGFEGQLFSNEQVEARSTYTPDYLRTLRLGRKRCIALGLRKILSRPGIRNVIVPEFSLLTLQVILLKLLFRYRFGIISHCDDSLDMLEGGYQLFTCPCHLPENMHAFPQKHHTRGLARCILVQGKVWQRNMDAHHP